MPHFLELDIPLFFSLSLLMQSNSGQLCNFWTRRKLQGGLILKPILNVLAFSLSLNSMVVKIMLVVYALPAQSGCY